MINKTNAQKKNSSKNFIPHRRVVVKPQKLTEKDITTLFKMKKFKAVTAIVVSHRPNAKATPKSAPAHVSEEAKAEEKIIKNAVSFAVPV